MCTGEEAAATLGSFVSLFLLVHDQGTMQQVLGLLSPRLERLKFIRDRPQASCKVM